MDSPRLPTISRRATWARYVSSYQSAVAFNQMIGRLVKQMIMFVSPTRMPLAPTTPTSALPPSKPFGLLSNSISNALSSGQSGQMKYAQVAWYNIFPVANTDPQHVLVDTH